MKSRVLLLQLMQNCFPMLPNPLEPRGSEDSKGPDEGATAGPSTSSSSEPQNDSVRAVGELYNHLCHSKNLLPAFIYLHKVKSILLVRSVCRDFSESGSFLTMCRNICSNNICGVCGLVVDGPEGETLVEKALHKETVKAILNGAAVFFPDKHVRRDKLFNMMVSLYKHQKAGRLCQHPDKILRCKAKKFFNAGHKKICTLFGFK